MALKPRTNLTRLEVALYRYFKLTGPTLYDEVQDALHTVTPEALEEALHPAKHVRKYW